MAQSFGPDYVFTDSQSLPEFDYSQVPIGLRPYDPKIHKLPYGPPNSPEKVKMQPRGTRFETIGAGACAYITTTDHPGQVLKGHQVWEDGRYVLGGINVRSGEEDIRREALILRHLGKHPRIVDFIGVEAYASNVHSLRLERAKCDVRSYIEKNPPPSTDIRLRLAIEAAEAVTFLDSKGVQHCDISCRNILLFEDFHVKMADFAFSMLKGSDLKEAGCEEPPYELPLRGRTFDERPAIKREIFALGSAIYELTAWEMPWNGLTPDQIEAKYAKEEFPSLTDNIAGDVIKRCWNEEFDTAQEVEEALKSLK